MKDIYKTEVELGVTAPSTSSFYYEGFWQLNDPVHPNGGTVTYIDPNGFSQESTYLWVGECRQIIARSITSVVGASTCVPA